MVSSSESQVVSEAASWGSWAAKKLAGGLEWLSDKCKDQGSYDNLKSTFTKVSDWIGWAVDGVKSLVSKFTGTAEAPAATPVPAAGAPAASGARPDAAAALRQADAIRPTTPVAGGATVDQPSAAAGTAGRVDRGIVLGD